LFNFILYYYIVIFSAGLKLFIQGVLGVLTFGNHFACTFGSIFCHCGCSSCHGSGCHQPIHARGQLSCSAQAIFLTILNNSSFCFVILSANHHIEDKSIS